MNNTRWFGTEIPISLNCLAELMLSSQYSSGNGEGFLLSKISKNEISGKYIKEIFLQRQLEDPLGMVRIFEFTEYNIVDFIFSSESNIGLQLINPPKLLKHFSNKIIELAGFGIVISQIYVDVFGWLDNLEQMIGKVDVNYVSCSGINVANKAVAKINIKSEQDIRKEFYEFIGKKNFLVDKLACSFTSNSQRLFFELRRNATAKYSHTFDSFTFNCINKSLLAAINSKSPDLNR